MPIRILEQYIQGKQVDQTVCEDRLVVTSNFVAVIDGVTSKSEYTWHGDSSGVCAARLIAQVLENASPDISFDAVLERINSSFQNLNVELGVAVHMNEHPQDRMQACLCAYSLERNELWFVGDCQALVAGILYGYPKKIDALCAELRSVVIETELRNGRTYEEIRADDPGRRFILPLIRSARCFGNADTGHPYDFAVIDGTPVPRKHRHVQRLSSLPQEIVIASDGYPVLFSTLGQSEAYLRDVNARDPLCFRENKGTKGLSSGLNSFDDRAYIRFVAE
jgi:hypothetical protein